MKAGQKISMRFSAQSHVFSIAQAKRAQTRFVNVRRMVLANTGDLELKYNGQPHR